MKTSLNRTLIKMKLKMGVRGVFLVMNLPSIHCRLPRKFPVMLLGLECRVPVKPVPAPTHKQHLLRKIPETVGGAQIVA